MSEYKKSVQGKRPQKKPNKFLNTIRLFMFWTIVIVIGMAVGALIGGARDRRIRKEYALKHCSERDL